jgi:hypothetical protein
MKEPEIELEQNQTSDKRVCFRLRFLNFVLLGSVFTIISGLFIISEDVIGRWWGWPCTFISSPLDAPGFLFHPNAFFLTFLFWGLVGFFLPLFRIEFPYRRDKRIANPADQKKNEKN